MFVVRQSEEFAFWLDGLHDMGARVRIVARLRQAEAGNLGDWSPVEGEVSEMQFISVLAIAFISFAGVASSS